MLPLICWQAWKMGTKEILLRSQAQKLPLQGELTQPLWIWAVTPKRANLTTLDLFISLYYHWKIVIVSRTTPLDPPLLKINDWTMDHVGPMVVTISLLLPIKTPSYLFYCPSPLPHLPEWLGFVINSSDQHLNHCFLISRRVHIFKEPPLPPINWSETSWTSFDGNIKQQTQMWRFEL